VERDAVQADFDPELYEVHMWALRPNRHLQAAEAAYFTDMVARVKASGAAARTELEALLERRVHLFLHVKVREDWQDKRAHYNEIGLDYDA
jgi:hypothetical protein